MIVPWPCWPRPPLPASPRDPLACGSGRRRLGFTGTRAREIWAPRLDRLAEAALGGELELIRDGSLPASLIWTPYGALAGLLRRLDGLGLAAVPVRTALGEIPAAAAAPGGDPLELLTYGLAVARGRTDEVQQRLASSDVAATARWLGYPDCCACAWASHIASDMVDPMAAMLSRGGMPAEPSCAHALLAGLGLGPVRHAPCSIGCRATAALAQSFLATVRALGLVEEADWLRRMGDWGVEISILNGVAEVKTGAFRYACLSDRLPARVQLRSVGSVIPDGAPPGLTRPFAPPRATTSRAVRRGPRPNGTVDLAAGFAPAGFANAIAMRSRWSTVLWEQSAVWRRAAGSAVHMGCGDGLLLELLAQHQPRLKLVGIETDPALAQAARQRGPLAGVPVLTDPWPRATAVLATLVEPEPLVFFDPEVMAALPVAARADIRQLLTGLSATLVALASDRVLARFGGIEAAAEAAGLSVAAGRPTRVSAIVQWSQMATGDPG